MTAWQYYAGAGMVAALCPLHGHVAVAGDGHGHGARVDVCVPAGRPKPPAVLPGPGTRPHGPRPHTPGPGRRAPTRRPYG
ncbi:hypothetical protein [Streptomyces sp. RerS4]|uniref:hypothetical protein n=1 Tax=Streptomyces sp. RerS4 TaxID=2942449 RepID=UPI00201BE1A4|nr:hypothetical protein [Streptomyces sp. RerS4]UQX03895.1 hypothetical protein M4D82_27895 [Streptomyces sp. RerS4]